MRNIKKAYVPLYFFVLDRPRVIAGDHVTVHEYGFVQLNCSAHGNPMPQSNNFKWIDNHGNEHFVQNYRIPSVNITNVGSYECVVSVNGYYGPLIGSASTRVTVICKFISHCTVLKVSSQLLHVIQLFLFNLTSF